MKASIAVILTACLSLSLSGCKGTASTRLESGIVSHASLFGMTDSCGSVSFSIANPWKKGVILQKMTVDKPFERVIVTTNSLAALMVELGVQDRIAGVCEPEWIMDSTITAMVADGSIADCGSSLYPNTELIMSLHPDAIFVSPFEGSGYAQLEKLGIPLVQCADYMETSALGRAEWLRLYGSLFGMPSESDSLFAAIFNDYTELCRLDSEYTVRPKVMLDTRSGSAWYSAGGGSTIGILLDHAGAAYAFGDRPESGSIPLAFETVFDKAGDSDIWLLKNSTDGTLTYSMLESDYSGYARFRPFKEKKIWVCDVNRTPYFEETAFHPERLLKDLIAIFHPESGLKPVYYHPLDN